MSRVDSSRIAAWKAGEAARERARLDRIVKRAEYFLGSLSRAQVRAFRPAIDALPPYTGPADPLRPPPDWGAAAADASDEAAPARVRHLDPGAPA